MAPHPLLWVDIACWSGVVLPPGESWGISSDTFSIGH